MHNPENQLEKFADYFKNENGKIVICIDGFIDEVWQVIKNKTSKTELVFYTQMQDFAKSIYDTKVGGYANEILRKRRVYGGFTGNTGRTVGYLGGDLTLIGMFGKEKIDEAFDDLQKLCKEMISVSEPAICQIYEFEDGKIMLPFAEDTANFDWETLTATISNDVLQHVFKDAKIVALGYWSQLHEFDDLVSNLCENHLFDGGCERLFFDFADLRKRSQQALETTFQLLMKLNTKLPMTLSLNEHEAEILYAYMGKTFDWKNHDTAEKNIDFIREQIGLDELVIHTPIFAVASTETEGTVTVLQRYCEKPVITAGAGDTFNGGYIMASATKGVLSVRERLLVGNAATSFYIRNGRSANEFEIQQEIQEVMLVRRDG